MSSQVMDAAAIGAVIRGKAGPLELAAIPRACQARREAIRARQAAIASPRVGTPPPERRAAELAGVEAVMRLDAEYKVLEAEFHLLDTLEAEAARAAEELESQRLRKAIPQRLRELPKLLERVREAERSLAAAMSAVAESMDEIGRYERAGFPFPFSDEELWEVLKLRENLRTNRELAVIPPPPFAGAWREFPRSWPLAYAISGPGRYMPRYPQIYRPVYLDPREHLEATTGRRGAGGEHVVAVGNIGRMG